MPLPAPTRGARIYGGKRMTANPAKPVDRWRPGQELDNPSSEEDSSSEDESEDEKQQQQSQEQQPQSSSQGIGMSALADPDHEAKQARARQAEEVARREEFRMREQMERDAGFVTESESGSEDEEEEDAEPRDMALPSDTATSRPPPAKATTTQSSDEEGSEEEEDSSSDESSSEDDKPRMIRPVFVRKDQRSTAKPTQADSLSTYQTEEQASALKARRQAEADALIQEQIDRKAAAKAAAQQDWDADDGGIEDEDAIDDTDDLDAALEQKLWIARELTRLKRDRAALEAREAELAELARRRALTTPEREAEDAAHLAAQHDARASRPKMAPLQKYHHRGAFFADDADAAHLRARDVMGARFVDQADKSALPDYLARRDDTRVGKKGATRYRDMRTEDTGRFGGGDGGRTREERVRDEERGRTGANVAPLGPGKRKGLSTGEAMRETAKKMRTE